LIIKNLLLAETYDLWRTGFVSEHLLADRWHLMPANTRIWWRRIFISNLQ